MVEIQSSRGKVFVVGGGMTTLVFLSILLLQIGQVIRLEIQWSTNNNANGRDNRVERMSNFANPTPNSLRGVPQSRQVGGSSSSVTAATTTTTSDTNTTTTSRTTPTSGSFSACLMFMDDNAHLIEWLAYHYHALPLRRLIVAVDPRSKTHPTEILQRWAGRIETTEWTDLDFMPPSLMDAHQQPDLTPDELTKLFRKRQEEFYARCMARLKTEGRTWTALIDTDEYIVPNAHSKKHYAYLHDHYTTVPEATVWDLLQARVVDEASTSMAVIHQETTNRDDPPHEAILRQQETYLANQIQETPCFPMARLTFGVKESKVDEVQSQIPWGFDGLRFQTLRWRWHAGRTSKKLNKISKALMDVSRVDSKLFVATKQVMVHLPIQEYCQGEDDLWILNGQSLLVVHHYGGTWEQWSHREDTRGKRTREAYDRMQYDKQSDDYIRPWLKHFVRQVGWWTARQLLRNVGDVP